jgi:hypothetical protein
MKANITAVYGPTEYHRESFAYGNPYQQLYYSANESEYHGSMGPY